jgi:mannose-6-phosphate isomerase-like protein (cupin superfamily)
MLFHKNIIALAQANNLFRVVIYTGSHAQIALMSIPVGEEIGKEVHNVDQVLVFVQGTGQAVLNDSTFAVGPYDMVYVPAGTTHNFVVTGEQDLKLFTMYAPAEHKQGLIHATKADADR